VYTSKVGDVYRSRLGDVYGGLSLRRRENLKFSLLELLSKLDTGTR